MSEDYEKHFHGTKRSCIISIPINVLYKIDLHVLTKRKTLDTEKHPCELHNYQTHDASTELHYENLPMQ